MNKRNGEVARAAESIRQKPAAVVIVLFLLITLCFGFVPVGALAKGEALPAKTTTPQQATLSVVYGVGSDGSPTVVANKTFDFYGEATVVDLLNAAKKDGAIKDYTLNGYGYLESITGPTGAVMKAAADFTTYWSSYENGAFYTGTDTPATEKLIDKTKYQFAWASYPTDVAPDWSMIPAADTSDTVIGTPPSETTPSSSSRTESTVASTTTSSSELKALEYSNASLEALMRAIIDSYAETDEPWQALGLAAVDRKSMVSKASLISNVLRDAENAQTTDIQRAILSLTAMGVDATAAPNASSKTDLVDLLAHSQSAVNTINGQIFAVLSYASGPYAVPDDAIRNEEELVHSIVAAQLPGGGFAYSGTEPDPDITAMAIMALSSQPGNTEASGALEKALSALKSLQRLDGGFSALAYGGSPSNGINTNTTAMVVMALCAAGIDPASSWVTAGGETPLSALMTQANATNTGFLYNGEESELATEQGFLALAAYQGFKNIGAPYNIYVKAKEGQASLPPAEPETTPVATSVDELASTSSTAAKSISKVGAATGDSLFPLIGVISLLMLVSLSTLLYRRRMLLENEMIDGDVYEYR